MNEKQPKKNINRSGVDWDTSTKVDFVSAIINFSFLILVLFLFFFNFSRSDSELKKINQELICLQEKINAIVEDVSCNSCVELLDNISENVENLKPMIESSTVKSELMTADLLSKLVSKFDSLEKNLKRDEVVINMDPNTYNKFLGSLGLEQNEEIRNKQMIVKFTPSSTDNYEKIRNKQMIVKFTPSSTSTTDNNKNNKLSSPSSNIDSVYCTRNAARRG